MIKFVSSVFLSFLKLTNICRKMHGNTVLLKKAPKDYQRMLGNITSAIYRVWARLRHCANPALQLKLSLNKMANGTICPLQNLWKKLKRKHTQRVLFQYRNCKLKQNMESIFYHPFKVHSKVMFQSCSIIP